jgi:hypothetical protein
LAFCILNNNISYIYNVVKKIPSYISIRGEVGHAKHQTEPMGDEGLEPPLKGL